jgi:Peptidase family S41
MCNGIGQLYYSAVVLITDALSYSATEILAAGLQDNKVGVVLSTRRQHRSGGSQLALLAGGPLRHGERLIGDRDGSCPRRT